LEELARWLHPLGMTHVTKESTGVNWKPVCNALEVQFELLLVNAQHLNNVPERKTDVKDSDWIVELLQHGSGQAMRSCMFVLIDAEVH
jgi:transposase